MQVSRGEATHHTSHNHPGANVQCSRTALMTAHGDASCETYIVVHGAQLSLTWEGFLAHDKHRLTPGTVKRYSTKQQSMQHSTCLLKTSIAVKAPAEWPTRMAWSTPSAFISPCVYLAPACRSGLQLNPQQPSPRPPTKQSLTTA